MTTPAPDAPTRPAFPYKTQPYGPYQRDILKRSASLSYAYLSMEQGTGKSWVTINTAAYLYLHQKIDAMVVLAPNGVHAAWAYDQIPQHMPDVVPWFTHVWRSAAERAAYKVRGTDWRARDEWDIYQLAKDYDRFPILCVNSEALRLPLCQKAIGTFLSMRKCLLVADEAGDFTTPSAKRSRILVGWRYRAPYRRVLEGVPIGQTPFDLYTPYKFLNSGILGYRTFRQMQDAHADWDVHERGDNGREFRTIRVIDGKKQFKNLSVLAERIAPVTFRTTKAEALPWLPPKQYIKRYFSMTAEQWRLTNELRDSLTTTLASGESVTINNILTLYLRYQQIACGYLPPDIIYGEETEPLRILPGPNPRLELCIEELFRCPPGTSTIIWTRFQFDIDLLSARLRSEGVSFVTYDGRTNEADRRTAREQFQAGAVPVFLGNAAAGGRGLNLFRAEQEIFYANYFGLRRRKQAEDRGHRIGSSATRPVQICDLVGAHSVDLIIVKALRQNQEVADAITGDPLQEWI